MLGTSVGVAIGCALFIAFPTSKSQSMPERQSFEGCCPITQVVCKSLDHTYDLMESGNWDEDIVVQHGIYSEWLLQHLTECSKCRTKFIEIFPEFKDLLLSLGPEERSILTD